MSADRLPPGPGRSRLLRSSIPAIRDPVRTIERLVREFGDVVSVRIGPIRMVVVGHPDLARDVLEASGTAFDRGPGTEDAKRFLGDGLLVSEGPFHAQQRRRMDPLLTSDAVVACADSVVTEAVRVRGLWKEGIEVDAFDEMRNLLAAIMIRNLDPEATDAEVRETTRALTTGAASFWRLFLPFPGAVERLPTRASRRFRAAGATLDRFVDRAIARAGRRGASEDLLVRLLAARDPVSDRAMSVRAAHAEALSLLFGSRAGVATGLTWTWYLLAGDPQVERRLHAEVDEVLGERPATAEDLPRLRLCRAVFAESMRLFPPAWLLKRRTTVDLVLGGYPVRAGTTLLVSPYVLHRDPRFHTDPERFLPERFDADPHERPALHRFAYIPFGGGAMGCIGEPFAWMAGPLALATFAQRWRLRPASGSEPPRMSWVITLKPRGGLPVVPEPRGRPTTSRSRIASGP